MFFNQVFSKFFSISGLASLIVLFFLTTQLKAEIQINKWTSEITLTENGKRESVIIEAEIRGLKKNLIHDGFTIFFDEKQDIRIKNISVDNRIPKYSFQKNRLKISFPTKKINGNNVLINYSFIQVDKKINKYLRQVYMSVPSWASEAVVRVSINIPRDYDVISLNRGVKTINQQLVFNARIPKSGYRELVKLTQKSSAWNVKIENVIEISKPIKSLQVKIPIYFLGGGQKNENNYTASTPTPNKSESRGKYYFLNYDNIDVGSGITKNIEIDIGSKIRAGKSNLRNIDKDPEEYLDVESEDWFLLSSVSREIKNNPKYAGLPEYAKVGQFVYDYITYDKSYLGKLLPIRSIINGKKGVCVEYAKLYNALARMNNIPSVIVSGIARGEHDKFEGHSWNLVYYKDRWISVDPTWNLMSGVVSSSHIYFYDEPMKAIDSRWSAVNPENAVKMNTEFRVLKAN